MWSVFEWQPKKKERKKTETGCVLAFAVEGKDRLLGLAWPGGRQEAPAVSMTTAAAAAAMAAAALTLHRIKLYGAQPASVGRSPLQSSPRQPLWHSQPTAAPMEPPPKILEPYPNTCGRAGWLDKCPPRGVKGGGAKAGRQAAGALLQPLPPFPHCGS